MTLSDHRSRSTVEVMTCPRASAKVLARGIVLVSASGAAIAALANFCRRALAISRAKQLVPPDTRIVLSVDIGSSSVRCSAYTVGSPPVALPGCAAQIKRPIVKEKDGTADAAEVVGLVELVVDECFRALRWRKISYAVVAVGFACFNMNLVGVDKDGHPRTPVYTYATTLCSEDVMKSLRQSLEKTGREGTGGLEEARRRTGSPMHKSYAASQLLSWLAVSESPSPEMNQFGSDMSKSRVKVWQTLPSLLAARWCALASAPISYSEASWMGLLDLHKLEWDDPTLSVLREAGFDCSTLPRLADVEGLRASPSGYALERWPELNGVSIRLGLGDGAAACLGSGCDDSSGLISVTVGTSAAARIVLRLGSTGSTGTGRTGAACAAEQAILVPKGLWCYRIDRDRVVLGGALSDGGSVFEWLCRSLGLGDRANEDEIMREASALPPASHGLTILPFFSGERSPGYHDNAKACILGIARSTTRAQLMRAGLESVCLRLAAVIDLMIGGSGDGSESTTDGQSSPLDAMLHDGANSVTSTAPMRHGNEDTSTTDIVPERTTNVAKLMRDASVAASGHAMATSSLWRQILADALGRKVYAPTDKEETSLGVAVLLSSIEDPRLCEGTTCGVPVDKAQRASIHTPSEVAVQAYERAAMEQAQAYKMVFGSGL